MFDSDYFKSLVNETADLIASRQNVPQEDKEELEARIDSNKMAMKILTEDIEDNETKQKILERIYSMYGSLEGVEIKTHKRNTNSHGHSRVEEDILKGALALKQKAYSLFEDLEFDKKVLEEVSNKMNKNLLGTSENIKKIKSTSASFSSFNLFIFGIIIFFITYIIIRFL